MDTIREMRDCLPARMLISTTWAFRARNALDCEWHVPPFACLLITLLISNISPLYYSVHFLYLPHCIYHTLSFSLIFPLGPNPLILAQHSLLIFLLFFYNSLECCLQFPRIFFSICWNTTLFNITKAEKMPPAIFF